MIKKSQKNKDVRFKIFLILSVLYAMFIFYLSSRSSFTDQGSVLVFRNIELFRNIFHYLSGSDLDFLLFPFYIVYKQLDKLVHIFLYAGLGFLLYHTIKNSSNPKLYNHAMVFTLILGSVYGASDEFHQSFVPGRTASIWDLAADSIGLITVQTAIFIKHKL